MICGNPTHEGTFHVVHIHSQYSSFSEGDMKYKFGKFEFIHFWDLLFSYSLTTRYSHHVTVYLHINPLAPEFYFKF
jgi:hypothetical protein